MIDFYLRAGIYFFCFLLSMYAMSALDFSRFIKKGMAFKAQVLYFILCCALSYLMGSFMMALIYRFHK